MAKHPILEDYRFRIKENLGRRGLALFVDEIVLTIPIFFLSAIFVFVIFQSNPFGIIIGQIAPLIYTYEVYGVTSTPTAVALIPAIFVVSGLMILYFTIFEARGKRTLGKKFFHLEVLTGDGKFITRKQAFLRNILKFVVGAVGFYLLGLLGFGLLLGIACFIDLKVGAVRKQDIRQRYSEAPFGTMVYLEHDEVPMGDISIPGEKIEVKKMKKKEPRPKRVPSLSGKRKKATLELGARSEKEDELPMKKKTPLLLGSEDEEKVEEKEEKTSLVPALMEKEQEKEDRPPDEEIEEKPKKKGFFSKLFGGGPKKVKEEKEEVHYEIEQGPGPDDLIHESGGLPPRKEVGRDEVVLQFMFDFDIDEKRAQGLYDMGYRSKPEFKDAIPQDLMMIDGVNPTVAKRIIKIASE